MQNKVHLSIVIVNYKVEKELESCISSIFKSKPEVEFEVIVVDNDRQSKIEHKLTERFPKVKYIASPGNIGFGAGNNLGAKYASGEYLFFLNPDTIVEKDSINELYSFIKRIGVVIFYWCIFITFYIPSKSERTSSIY